MLNQMILDLPRNNVQRRWKRCHFNRREESVNAESWEFNKFWDKQISLFARNDTGLNFYLRSNITRWPLPVGELNPS